METKLTSFSYLTKETGMGQRRLDRVPRREKGLPANSRRGLASLRPLVRLRSGAFSEPAHQGKTPWERRPWPLQAPGRLLPFHAPGQSVDVLQNVGRPREPSPGPSRARPGRIRGARNPGHGHGSLQTHLPRNRRAQLPLNRPRGRARLWPRLSVGFPPLVFVQSPGRFQHSPPGSSVHGDSPGKNTGVGCHALLRDPSQVSCLAGGVFTV